MRVRLALADSPLRGALACSRCDPRLAAGCALVPNGLASFPIARRAHPQSAVPRLVALQLMPDTAEPNGSIATATLVTNADGTTGRKVATLAGDRQFQRLHWHPCRSGQLTTNAIGYETTADIVVTSRRLDRSARSIPARSAQDRRAADAPRRPRILTAASVIGSMAAPTKTDDQLRAHSTRIASHRRAAPHTTTCGGRWRSGTSPAPGAHPTNGMGTVRCASDGRLAPTGWLAEWPTSRWWRLISTPCAQLR
jgi:hypothetical protein